MLQIICYGIFKPISVALSHKFFIARLHDSSLIVSVIICSETGTELMFIMAERAIRDLNAKYTRMIVLLDTSSFCNDRLMV